MQSNVLTSSVFVGSWSEKFASEDELPRHANVRADHDAAHAENENETLQRNGTHSNNKAKNINQMEAMVQARVAERRPALSWPSLKRAILIDEPLVRTSSPLPVPRASAMHVPQWSFPIPNGQPEAEASERPTIYGVA